MEKKGFSLIEIITVLAIFFILIGVFAISFISLRQKSSLDSISQEIIQSFRFAQSQTLASKNSSSFGLYFENNRYVVFKGTNYDPAEAANQEYTLPSEVRISQINVGAASEVVFNRLTGTTDDSGFIKIELTTDATKNKTIYVAESGAVSFSPSNFDDSARLKDSRHSHVAFEQNTKGSLVLSLDFPNDGVTQNIDYQAGLDAAKTEFFWQGTASVSGVPQILKIHSHLLNDTTTIFCFHRDRRFNTKALSISLDGENLINYTNTGTTTPGASFWASAPQEQ